MQYSPFASDIELPFYTALASHKINHDKLDDSARSVLGLYEIRSTDPANASCRMQIHGNALASNESVRLPAYGLSDFGKLISRQSPGSVLPRRGHDQERQYYRGISQYGQGADDHPGWENGEEQSSNTERLLTVLLDLGCH